MGNLFVNMCVEGGCVMNKFLHNFFVIAFLIVLANIGFYTNIYESTIVHKQKILTTWQKVQNCYTKSLSYAIRDYVQLNLPIDDLDIFKMEMKIVQIFIQPSDLLNDGKAYIFNKNKYISSEELTKGKPISIMEFLKTFELMDIDTDILYNRIVSSIETKTWVSFMNDEDDRLSVIIQHIKVYDMPWAVMTVIKQSDVLNSFGYFDEILTQMLTTLFISSISIISLFNIYVRFKSDPDKFGEK